MAVISLRLNTKEEKMVQFLTEYYEEDRSALIKHLLQEMYEDIADNNIIREFEKKEEKRKVSFISANRILNMLK
ncbi:hypothetical protein RDn1_154 [Candidatus Termititenax dinenymphae]|uniref:CopG family transcriptional regulator n=1 Tax=Candidatus Termititenax dinenymphae TaxID=2218523 RepID=A0A388TMF7_9BACT|nr:hypothetical protein RDn1_154 [Candidatus Termititenax dinenymphae]